MKKWSWPVVFFPLLIHATASLAQTKDPLQAPEKIFYHANIYTGQPSRPFAEAIAIRGETIVAVGSFEEVKNRMSDQAVLIDMNGQTLLPGFVDSHMHAIDGGTSLAKPNVNEDLLEPDSLQSYVLRIIREKSGMYGDVVMIDGINITTWSNLKALDQVFNKGTFARQPVLLGGSDGHTAWANNAMLKKAGVNGPFLKALTPEQRHDYGTNPDGTLNGFVVEGGVNKLMQSLPEEGVDLHQSALLAMEYCNRYGITAILDPAAVRRNQDLSKSSLEAYDWLADQHKLTTHVAATVVVSGNDDPDEKIPALKKIKSAQDREDLRVIGFKIFGDGVIEYPSQTAALSKPYLHSGKNGKLLFEPARFARFVTAADSAGFLVHVHAIGDRTVTEALNGFETMRRTNQRSDIPHTITHLQIVLPSDFDRFHQLGILASFQLMWAFGDETAIDIVQPYIAPDLFRWQYPARSLLQAGAEICGASDWPVTGANPFEAIARAETRKGPLGVLDSTQCMPRIAMLQAYTLHAAHALMMEKQIGSLEPGKFADMVLVDRDVLVVTPEELAQTRVLWTMFRGRIVYQANKDQ